MSQRKVIAIQLIYLSTIIIVKKADDLLKKYKSCKAAFTQTILAPVLWPQIVRDKKFIDAAICAFSSFKLSSFSYIKKFIARLPFELICVKLHPDVSTKSLFKRH